MSRYQFMQNHDQRFDLAEMSEALGISRSGYYRWAEAKPSARRERNELIKPVIEQVVRLAHGPYGYRPVHQHLREQGVDCGYEPGYQYKDDMGVLSGATRSQELTTL